MADSHRCSSVAAELEGTLLISGSLFPYFLLVALEAGGPLRAATLLVLYPLAVLLGAVAAATDLPLLAMAFLSTAGLPASDVSAVARATLPKFFLSDLRASAFRSMATAGESESERLVVVTHLPRLLAEPFVKEYLGPDVRVAGSELRLLAGRFTGTLASPSPAFPQVCKQRRAVAVSSPAAAALPRSEYRRPLVFHDGRLVFRPEPLACLAAALWVPLGVVLSVTRLLLGFLPHGAGLLLAAATGFRIRAAGLPSGHRRGTLFACNHQTLMDPVILSTVLRRPVTAVTYSLSGFSEAIAPIRTVRLTRDRQTDAEIMRRELVTRGGDLVVCPEGTTCREPYLLRFSPLFAEVAAAGDQAVVTPTAVRAGGALFHGSTVRGYKWLDSVFFLMNPAPWYEIRILKPVATAAVGGGGGGGAAASREVANGVQRVIGDELGFECTELTRKDKYRMIAGHDGVDARSAAAAAS
ncbi:unnamed protein product [Urochloa decumbens]|uniref:Phospholipid/glycerol acyltransferase domain-containing protein n=1 Tax=Urochloa decumbens TaxID=240449 RepID=A0ABC9BWU2_9POAL